MSESPVLESKIPAWKWAVVWTLFLSTMLNYMDRQTMGSTAEHIKKEFTLNNEGWGWIEFYFGISFAIMQLFAGWMADRMNLRWLFAGAVLLWSAAGFLTGIAETLIFLYTCRIVLAIGESFNWVCAGGVIQRIIPRESRSLANAIFHGGASIGAALTPLVAAAIVGAQGENWRTLFLLVGGAGLLWAVLWFGLINGKRADLISSPIRFGGPKPLVAETPFSHVLMLKTFWITLLFGTAVNVMWHFYRVWLPILLKEERGMSGADFQYVLCAFFVAADLGSLATGWITRQMIRGGMTVERARTFAMFGAAALCLLSGPATAVTNLYIAIPMILLVGAGAMGCFASYFAMSQEISGPHTSRCLGLIGALIWGLLAVMHPVVGRYADTYVDGFKHILYIVGFIPLLGSFLGLMWPTGGASFDAPAPVPEKELAEKVG